MFGEQQLRQRCATGVLRQLIVQQLFKEQFFLQPHRHRREERANAARRVREIRFKQPLELDQRLVVKGNEVYRFE